LIFDFPLKLLYIVIAPLLWNNKLFFFQLGKKEIICCSRKRVHPTKIQTILSFLKRMMSNDLDVSKDTNTKSTAPFH
jgi:hypothetical protein